MHIENDTAQMTDNDSRLGLRDDEVNWLRRNVGTNKTATLLVNLYQQIVDKPHDTLTRTQFQFELGRWRKRVENGDPVP